MGNTERNGGGHNGNASKGSGGGWGWGMPMRRAEDLAGLMRWPAAEPKVVKAEVREARAAGERSPRWIVVSSAKWEET